MYILMVLISACFLGCYDVLKKVSLKQSSVYEMLFFSCACGFLVSLFFIGGGISLGIVDLLLILLKSVIIVGDWILVAKCVKKLDVAIVVAASLINTLLTVLGSYIFFGEPLGFIHLFSLLFISVGIMLITKIEKKDNPKEAKNDYKYLVFLFVASLLGACSGLLDKYILNYRHVSHNEILMFFLLFNAIIYFVIYFIKNKKIEFKKLKSNFYMILTGVSIALADIFYYYSITMEGSQISLVSILRKSSVIVATILASVFLKEKHLLKKLGVLVIMLVGVALPIIF